jgi:hypothetical protein
MAISLFNLSQQVSLKTGKGMSQQVIQDVRNAYATCMKQLWFESKNLDVSEINGTFIFQFPNITPIYDTVLKQYYIEAPSSYIALPQENGINWICYMSEPDLCFVMCNAGTIGRLNQILAGVMGGQQLYYPMFDTLKNKQVFVFPRMTNATCNKIMIRLTLALDTVSTDAPLDIPPNVQDMIVTMVVAKYLPEQPVINEKIK